MDTIDDILRHDKYNIERWNNLFSNSARDSKLTREIYDSFLKVFPTAARYWKLYIEKEISLKNYKLVEKLFKKCLFNCLDVELWRTYITYIRIVKKNTEHEMKDINTAYEFVIKNVGMDVNSAVIWSDHIGFLKNELRGVSNEDRKKAVRGVYHLALVTPMSGVDQVWREYDSWEHINDKALAKGMLAGLYQQHQNAKSCCLFRKRLKRSILPGLLAKPPYGESKAHERDYLQVIHWKKLIDYEKSNPQKLGPNQLEERIVFTYKQALMYLRFYPEIWDAYSKSFFERHTLADAEKIYEAAIRSALPTDLTMHFLYAEFLEAQKEIEKAREVYERLLKSHGHPLAYVQFQRFARRSESKEAARTIFVRAKKEPDCDFHIFLSSAYIEHFQNSEPKIALKILNLGLEKFISEPRFVSAYIDFLELQTDINNMREIFERVLSQMKGAAAEPIWAKYIAFEQKRGSELKLICALNERRASALDSPETKEQIDLLKSYSFLGLAVCPKDYFKTMEKVLFAKIQDVPGTDSLGASYRRAAGNKAYTFKGVTEFAKPDLNTMIEIKPGVDFIHIKKAHSDRKRGNPPQLPKCLKALLLRLPQPLCVQGIPVKTGFMVKRILNFLIDDEKVKGLDGQNRLVPGEAKTADGDDDLFAKRRKN